MTEKQYVRHTRPLNVKLDTYKQVFDKFYEIKEKYPNAVLNVGDIADEAVKMGLDKVEIETKEMSQIKSAKQTTKEISQINNVKQTEEPIKNKELPIKDNKQTAKVTNRSVDI